MRGTKKKQQRKCKSRANETNKSNSSNKIDNSNRSSSIVTKNFEIFVTDFLTDPCGLPVELRDCVLVDGTTSLNDTSDNCSSNSCQVLKKIFGNNESIDRIVKNSVPLIVDGKIYFV
ncbi:unnamed protein product [Rotaria sp. Silwood2]|nr:unnamed protein product [Rotaria sp. Silwood2]CAF2607174.1 unnamed protein product [Rotaria sp. Silwood2]CAF3021293.1 unnamed protein product [Rotaria sp. Silwood2]